MLLIGGGRRTRTSDLWVMSPTSYHCSIPRCFVSAKLLLSRIATKHIATFLLLKKVNTLYLKDIPLAEHATIRFNLKHPDVWEKISNFAAL